LFVTLIQFNFFHLQPDTKFTVQAHTVCATQIDKNNHNRTFCNGVASRTTGLQWLSWHYCSLIRNTW